MTRGVVSIAAVAVLLAALPAPAAAKVAPFGHPCTLENGVFFCPTQNDSQRVKSFDGVPLDVDVTVPTRGLGHPFPTIVMLHGFPGSKQTFESDTPAPPDNPVLYHYNNNYFAKQGYLVVNYSARGFGRSCGDKSSRTSPGCDRGWFHLADQRFEQRDAQVLLARLVDEGYTDPKRIGVTGVSYGGGSSLQLAYLKDRIRKRDGDFAPWVSKSGKRLSIAAAHPRWGWSDLAFSLVPNGRFADWHRPGTFETLTPPGVPKRSIIDALYIGGTALGFLAPKGADPTADVATWREKLYAEPYGADVAAIGRQFHEFKSGSGLNRRPAPLLIMDGWTDPVFTAIEALRTYNRHPPTGDPPYVSLQLGDLGHFRGGNALRVYKDFAAGGAAFFARFLKGRGGGPPAGSVKAYGQGCPKGTVGPGPIAASTWSRVARGSFFLKHPQYVTIRGGDEPTSAFFNPVANGDPCSTTAVRRSLGMAVFTRPSKGFTLAGLTTIRAKVENSDSFGQIDALLFDVSNGRERLVDHATYRLRPDQDGQIEFQLSGNLYRFAPGHTVRVELRGRFEPWFLADRGSSTRVGWMQAHLPTSERPNPERDIHEKLAHPRD